MDQSGAPHLSRPHRAPVLLKANLRVSGKTHVVKLRNLSEEGALIEADDFPPEGVYAWFERNELKVRATIIWVHSRFAGLKFERPLKSEEVLRHVPIKSPPKHVEFKRPGLACRPLSNYERKMLDRWMTDVRST